MAHDDDVARLLPEPPPPRPTRREASIAEALRRFDGGETAAPVVAPRPTRWLGRPQIGVLVSAALIALIGAPAAWLSLHDRFPAAHLAPTTKASAATATADVVAPAATPAPPSAAALERSSAAARQSAPPSTAAPRAFADKAGAEPQADSAVGASQPSSPPPPPPAMKMAAPPPPPAAIIAPAAPSAEARPADTGDIMVTGSRRHAPVVADRVEDFARAPDDDLDGVMARFDQALARDPHNSRAWLDRGRARQRKGDLAGALDDIDHAIRLAPEGAAGYRARAQLERQRGDARRAAADERRAAELEADR